MSELLKVIVTYYYNYVVLEPSWKCIMEVKISSESNKKIAAVGATTDTLTDWQTDRQTQVIS